jgi:sulfopyruvate decarboxylase alpha subunit
MQDSPEPRPDPAGPDWPGQIHQALRAWQVRQVAYVPDAGHSRLIELCHADPEIAATVLSTEEEGIALLAGAWLGGQRGVLLMQSSGVGNCINMLSLVKTCRLPFVTLVTMRGEWGEFNPWQVPMGSTTRASLELAGVTTYRVEHAEAVRETVDVALAAAYDTQGAAAVILSQKLLGRKQWTK